MKKKTTCSFSPDEVTAVLAAHACAHRLNIDPESVTNVTATNNIVGDGYAKNVALKSIEIQLEYET